MGAQQDNEVMIHVTDTLVLFKKYVEHSCCLLPQISGRGRSLWYYPVEVLGECVGRNWKKIFNCYLTSTFMLVSKSADIKTHKAAPLPAQSGTW